MTNSETNTNPGESKKPTHIAYNVKDGREKAFWNPIGVAWAHGDGKGFTAELDCFPKDGKVTFRVNQPKPQSDEPESNR